MTDDLDLLRNLSNGKSGREAARRLADVVLARYREAHNAATHPYDPRQIAPLLLIRSMSESSALTSDAAISPVAGGFQILLKSRGRRERQSYSIAHELGHTFFYDSRGSVPVKLVHTEEGLKEEERRCDEFAAALLMPADEFTNAFRTQMMGGGNGIAELASQFKVSLLTALIRVKHLRLEPANSISLVLERRPNAWTGKKPKWRVWLAVYPHSVMFIPENIGAESLGLDFDATTTISPIHQRLTVAIRKTPKSFYKTKGHVHCSGTQVKTVWGNRSCVIMLLTYDEVVLPPN